eukprot:9473497-Pyramimonas_sp.AAC.1
MVTCGNTSRPAGTTAADARPAGAPPALRGCMPEGGARPAGATPDLRECATAVGARPAGAPPVLRGC